MHFDKHRARVRWQKGKKRKKNAVFRYTKKKKKAGP